MRQTFKNTMLAVPYRPEPPRHGGVRPTKFVDALVEADRQWKAEREAAAAKISKRGTEPRKPGEK